MKVNRREALRLSALGAFGLSFKEIILSSEHELQPGFIPMPRSGTEGPFSKRLVALFERLHAEVESTTIRGHRNPDYLEDRLISLLQPGQVTMLEGVGALDRYTLSYLMALSCARRGMRVAWVSPIDCIDADERRFLATESCVSIDHFTHGDNLYSQDWKAAREASARLYKLPLEIFVMPKGTPPSIVNVIKDVSQIDVIFLSMSTNDFFTAYTDFEKGKLEEARQVLWMAKEYSLPIVYTGANMLLGQDLEYPDKDQEALIPMLYNNNAVVYFKFNMDIDVRSFGGDISSSVLIQRPGRPVEIIPVVIHGKTGAFYGI